MDTPTIYRSGLFPGASRWHRARHDRDVAPARSVRPTRTRVALMSSWTVRGLMTSRRLDPKNGSIRQVTGTVSSGTVCWQSLLAEERRDTVQLSESGVAPWPALGRMQRAKLKSQRSPAPGAIRPRPASITAGRGHIRRRPAPSRRRRCAPYKPGAGGSNPPAPTKFRRQMAHGQQRAHACWIRREARLARHRLCPGHEPHSPPAAPVTSRVQNPRLG
jgi:hypothetical protein